LELRYDLSNVGALKENEDNKTKRVIDLFKMNLLTRNEARYQLDYQDIDEEEIFYQDTLAVEVPIVEVQDIPQVPTLPDMPDDEEIDNIEDTVEEVAFMQIVKKKNDLTDFPKAGDDEVISLKNSKYELFPFDYAENIKQNYPDVWNKGGNIQGNDTYQVLSGIIKNSKTNDELTKNDKDIIKMREAWSARHTGDFLIAGVIAQVKWLTIGSRGLDHMKQTIKDEIDKQNKKYMDMTRTEEEKFYKAFEKKRDPYYTKVEKKVRARFNEELITILESIKNSTPNDVYQDIDKTLLDGIPIWQNLITSVYISVIEDFGNTSFNEIINEKALKKFNVYDEIVMGFIKNSVAEDVTQIDATTRSKLKLIINDSFSAGDSINVIAESINNLYTDIFKESRAKTIARTETISSSNAGSYYGAVQTGVTLKKKWIPTFDDSTRDTHLAMGSKPSINLDELFNVGNSRGSFAGDPTLSAKERINCRCTLAYERKQGTIEPEVFKIDERENLTNSIISNHEKPFKSLANAEELKIELKNILSNMSEDDLIVYNKLSKNFKDNEYNLKNSVAYYTPSKEKIFMNINNNNFERITLINREGAFNTKFHEEFHQLDHILEKTTVSNNQNSITFSSGVLGEKINKSIKSDVLNVLNLIREINNKPKITTFEKITSTEKLDLVKYLRANYPNRSDRAEIAMFTDTVGAVTKGELGLGDFGFWAHENKYYKNNDKSMEEAFAEYGAYKFSYTDEQRIKLKSLMPNTIDTLDSIYRDIVIYAKNNEFEYLSERFSKIFKVYAKKNEFEYYSERAKK
jgi:hypothetical protein